MGLMISAGKLMAASYLLAMAGAVAAHFLATQFYDPYLEGSALTAWRILDPMMLAGILVVFGFALCRKCRQGCDNSDEPITREYFAANITFYFTAALLLAFLWNWFGVEWVDPRNDNGLVWIFIDATLPVLFAKTAVGMLRDVWAQLR